ncbi:Ig-like domain-containing protein [Butyrivibrio sp. JL13D10]|uniref:Ig-like domain-containing protein n=1 Tax=Butyrivibrio sp. JL13D10 TaxID=3236815 RepID=UPI0038B51D67
MKQKMKQWLGTLLSIALILGLMPGMSLTAYAAGAYNDYLVTTDANKNKSGEDLTALQVKFNEKPWYIIADNSTAVNAGTVTLLAADTSFGKSAFDSTDPYSRDYSGSTVKSKLDALTAEGDSFAGVKDAIVDPDLTDVSVTVAKLYLLNITEARKVPENVRKFSDNWWLRSPGYNLNDAASVDGGYGYVRDFGSSVNQEFVVRPALKLNLASVIFESGTNTFEPVVDQKDNTPKAEVEGLDEDLATNVMNDDDNKNTGNSGTIEPVVDQKENTPKAEVEGLDEELATNVMTDDEKNKIKIDASTGFYSGLKISQKNGKIKVSWDKGEDASKYAVYAAYCGKEFASKPVKTTKSTSATFKKINGKKIDFSKNLKIYVTAYDASGKKIGNTVSAHFAGKNNKKYKNPKAVKLTTTALTIEVGKSAKVKASVKMESGKKIALDDAHCAKLRYKTTNEKIATVDKNGNVTGVAAGTCEVYVYSKNGLAKKCTVTVK